MDFKAYCKSKNIDPIKFQTTEPQRFSEWEFVFDRAGAVSFTQQKLFLINEVRRQFKLEKDLDDMDNKPIVEESAIISTPKIKPTGFKPKYK
ncbi:MAG: hypothetical protein ACKVOU_10045 [Cytophagales bacterium]